MSDEDHKITATFSSPAAPDYHFNFPSSSDPPSLTNLIQRLSEAKTVINEHLTKAVDEERAAAGDSSNGQAAKKLKT